MCAQLDLTKVDVDGVVREAAHVAYLTKALGTKAIKEPTFDFATAVTDEATFTATSQTLEKTGVGAYFGQAFSIAKAAKVLTAVDGRRRHEVHRLHEAPTVRSMSVASDPWRARPGQLERGSL